MNISVQPSVMPDKRERHRRFGSVDPLPGTKPTSKEEMADLQNLVQDYLFSIEQVGISRVKHPIEVTSDLAPQVQTSIAELKLTTSLGRNSKGINMSRLTEQLEAYRQKGWTSDIGVLHQFAEELAHRMKQEAADIEISFPWFYERPAPKTGLSGLNHAEATMKVAYEAGKPIRTTLGLIATVTTLCPCSKEISEYSAHNQRGIITIEAVVAPGASIDGDWKSILLEAAESNASSPLHPILKRPDEKAVTERAYENPRFVEDLARLVAADLYEQSFIRSFTVECRNEESIHLHDAVARIRFDKENIRD